MKPTRENPIEMWVWDWHKAQGCLRSVVEIREDGSCLAICGGTGKPNVTWSNCEPIEEEKKRKPTRENPIEMWVWNEDKVDGCVRRVIELNEYNSCYALSSSGCSTQFWNHCEPIEKKPKGNQIITLEEQGISNENTSELLDTPVDMYVWNNPGDEKVIRRVMKIFPDGRCWANTEDYSSGGPWNHFEPIKKESSDSGEKYHKPVQLLAQYTEPRIDVYAVLDAFGVTNPAIAHSIKKQLMFGRRGKAGAIQDLKESIDATNRAIQIEEAKELRE